jgi:hypothetical protein
MYAGYRYEPICPVETVSIPVSPTTRRRQVTRDGSWRHATTRNLGRVVLLICCSPRQAMAHDDTNRHGMGRSCRTAVQFGAPVQFGRGLRPSPRRWSADNARVSTQLRAPRSQHSGATREHGGGGPVSEALRTRPSRHDARGTRQEERLDLSKVLPNGCGERPNAVPASQGSEGRPCRLCACPGHPWRGARPPFMRFSCGLSHLRPD